jgi:hypothetical protein
LSDRGRLEVRGGVSATSACLEDLERAGELLRDAAARLADHGRAVLVTSLDPRLQLTAALSPLTFARAEAALAAAACGPGGLFALAVRAELLGNGVRAVAEGYRRADSATAETLRAVATLAGQAIVGQAIGRTLGAVAPGLLLGTGAVATVVVLSGSGDKGLAGQRRRALPESFRRTGALVLRLLAAQGALVETAIPVLPGVIGGFTSTLPGGPVITARVFGQPTGPTTVAEVAAGLGAIGRLAGAATGTPSWFRDSNQVRVRAVPAQWQRAASGTSELLSRIPPAVADQPRIHVERVDGVDGRRWVVSVPGTANWSPVAGRTPFDLTGNVRLMAAQRSAGMSAVVAAMRATGVRSGEPVLLAGYSQGGLIAASVAADPSVRREFTVSHLLTSGAPVASIPVPDDVQVLSIEHSDDLVPRLEGSMNRDRPNWITVTAPAPITDLPPVERTEPLSAHRAELYQSTADRIDRSTHPTLALWRLGLAPFLGAGGRSSAGPSAPPAGAGKPDNGAGWDVEVSRVGTP